MKDTYINVDKTSKKNKIKKHSKQDCENITQAER